MIDMNRKTGLDDLMDEAFSSFPALNMPDGFTDRLIRRVERKLIWQTLLTEFGLKVGIIAGTLAVLVAAFFLLSGNGKPALYHIILSNWQFVAALVIAVFFTFLFDQVLLKYLFSRSK
jgi:hypothetical protein